MKIGSTFNHEIYGPLKITKKRYSRMGNKSLWVGVDEQGEDHELDGSEKPAKPEKSSPQFLKEASELLGMTQGPKGADADEDYIIEAVIPRVLEQIRLPEDGKDGADADVELIIRGMLPLVMENMPKPKELNESLIIQKIVSRIRIPQDGKPGEKGKDGSPDTPTEIKGKLETLKGDDRLDASAIKNLPKPTMQFGGDSYTGLAKVDSSDTPGTLESKIVAGTNVTITKVNDTLRIASSGGAGGGQVDSVVAGNNIDVDATDPANPIVSVETLTLADISGVTASTAEVNVLDGIPATLTATELGYVDGVTSAIQTQIDGKVSDTGDAMSGNLAITIPNSGNALGLTVTQNDTTNNPRGASITNTGTGNALFIDQNGATSSSTSVGGAILLDNTGNTGAGLIIYSNAGASSGRLMNIRADNVLFDQPALHIDYDGTTNAFEILHNSTDSSANAISVVSVNQNDSTVGITGQESGKGTIKITHNKPDGVADASAAAISLSLGRVNAGETSAAQGIFLDTTHVTTGKLLNLRNNGTEQAVVSANGVLSLVGTAPAIELGHASDTTLSRVSAGVVAIEGVNILTVAGGTMTGNITLGENTSLALDPAGSADGKYSGITVAGTAGYTQAFGDLVYLDPTDSRWEACDANAAAAADGDARGLIGMVVSAGTDGTACTILLEGIIRADANFPALTIGAPVYVAETAGDIVVAQPTTTDAVIRMVGAALTADEIFFRPDFSYTTHT